MQKRQQKTKYNTNNDLVFVGINVLIINLLTKKKCGVDEHLKLTTDTNQTFPFIQSKIEKKDLWTPQRMCLDSYKKNNRNSTCDTFRALITKKK